MNLYDQVLLDHNRHPHNFRVMPEVTHTGEAENPLCGDQVTVYLHVDDGNIVDVSFQGKACAVAMASASLMTEALLGRSFLSLADLCQQIADFLEGRLESPPVEVLAPLARVRQYPIRIGCATLPWKAIRQVL